MNEEDFESHHQAIFKIFLTSFDFTRTLLNKGPNKLKELNDIETSVINAFETFVLKTNKLVLRKLFL